MLIPPSRHHLAMNALLNQSIDKMVLVFVSLECDSVCCCNILEYLFRLEHIRFTIIPVTGYQNLKQKFDLVISSDFIVNSVILLNNGGSVDICSFFEGENDISNISFYVFDSHRPFDLSNVSEQNENVLIFSDEDSMNMTFPQDFSSLEEQDEKNEEKEREIINYYRGSYYGLSISFCAYKIARKLSKNTNDILWCAIVGLTDQIEHEKIRMDQYTLNAHYLQQETLQFNIPSNSSQFSQNSISSQVSSQSLMDSQQSDTGCNNLKERGHIEFSQELKFLLYRHWTVYESIYHSKYMATNFQYWRNSGKKRLMDFIAKLSIPIKECKRPFKSMSAKHRLLLCKSVLQISEKFKLENIFYGSFIRKYNRKTYISPSEIVQSMNALFSRTTYESEDFMDYFWKAYNTVNIKHSKSLKEGVNFSKNIWKAIIRQGTLIVEKRSYTASGPFRYTIIDEIVDHVILSNVINLTNLALFLVSILNKGKNRKSKPFVLFALHKARGTYSVIGLPSKNAEEFAKNTFGNAFRESAEKTGCRFKQESFEAYFIEIQKEDNHKFLEHLHSGLVQI